MPAIHQGLRFTKKGDQRAEGFAAQDARPPLEVSFFEWEGAFPGLCRLLLVWREVAFHVALAEPQVGHEQADSWLCPA